LSSSTLILIAGLGVAGWWYLRSQQAQAAALAAAQSAPGPSTLGKLENSASSFLHGASRAVGTVAQPLTNVAGGIAGAAAKGEHAISGAVSSIAHTFSSIF